MNASGLPAPIDVLSRAIGRTADGAARKEQRARAGGDSIRTCCLASALHLAALVALLWAVAPTGDRGEDAGGPGATAMLAPDGPAARAVPDRREDRLIAARERSVVR